MCLDRAARIAALLAALSFAGCSSCNTPAGPPKLNVIIVLSDALRAASLPMYGYPRNTAPHLAALARASIVFDTHLVHFPGTPFSVSQLMTGRLVPPLLIDHNYIAVAVRGIPPDLFILPQALKAAGYRTGIVTSHYWINESTRLLRFFDSQALIRPSEGQSKAGFSDLAPAIHDFIETSRRDGRPFFLYVHSIDTHGPYEYQPGFEQFRDATDYPDTYNRYDSEILYTDHWVNQIIEQLRDAGLLDRTIFAFTADHGEELGDLGPERWNSHHGATVRRVLMHVPLIIRLPGDPTPGRRYRGLTRHIDVAPTLYRLAVPGATYDGYRVDGDDLSGELRGGGDGSATHRLSFGFNIRYWGVYDRTEEVHYDQWENAFSPLLRATWNARNYPILDPVDDAATHAALQQALAREYEARTQEYLNLPPSDDLPSPAFIEVPSTVVPPSAVPTYYELPDDDRWAFTSESIKCELGEHPGAVTLATPWVPGRYHVSVGLQAQPRREGYLNEFQIQLGSDNPPVHVGTASSAIDSQGWADIGEQTIGTRLEMHLSEPEGGAAIFGLKLERLDGGPSGPQDDPALQERLRILGYGQQQK